MNLRDSINYILALLNPFVWAICLTDLLFRKGYKIASKKFYPAIDKADEVWVYAPDGVGEHTQRDIDYAKSKGKTIKILNTLLESVSREKQT